MTERDIFLAALEIVDPAARATYVARACGDNAALRAEVEELLRTHDETSQFLETPAAATNAIVEKTVIGDSSIEDDDSDGPPLSGTEFSRYLEPATRPGWIGRLGHYEIEQILGRGAFGIVAKAFDDKLHRVVAIKFMNPTLAATSPPRKRFLREARTAAAVTHENIVAIYAVEEEPIPYLVMEYIPGQTLQQRMDANGPFDIPETLKLGRQIAFGLAAAHAANLIHRDIKPANILLTGGTNERAKISDFGLARAVDDASLTSSGLIAGTPMYMSPEQARGETLDHRTDLFSLGSVLYQMASGRPPFRAANTIAVLKRVCEDRPRPLDDVMPGAPEWLQTIIFRLMEKDRDNRYQSAGEVAELLERCESELRHNGRVTSVFTAPGTQVLQRDTPPNSVSHRNPLAWLIMGVTALVMLVGFMAMNGGKRATYSTTVSSGGTPAAASSTPSSIKTNPAGDSSVPSPEPTAPVWQPTSEQQAFFEDVANLPAIKQIEAVINKLREVNPEFDGQATHRIEYGAVAAFSIDTGDVSDIWPVRALSGLVQLNCNGTKEKPGKLRDLSPLAGLKLTTLNCTHTAIDEFAPLQGMPLKILQFNETPVSDLSPLRGMPLETLWGDNSQISDLAPLAGMKLASLNVSRTRVSDLSPLQGMPLSQLHCYQTPVSDLSLLKDASLTVLSSNGTRISDLSPLKGMPLAEIQVLATPVVDLSPLQGTPLKLLVCDNDLALKQRDILREIKTLETINGKPAKELLGESSQGWPADAPPLAIAPFNADQAKKHQEEWAAYLKVPVEYTNSIGMKFRLIPPGEFLMGSTPEEIAQIVRDLPDDSRADEWIRRSLEASVPQHRVLLTNPFFLGVHEVTQSQFLRVTDRNPSAFSSAGSKKDIVTNMDTSTFPVESARWEDCTDFLRRLSKLESLSSNGESAITGYRLPSEAEWEFACRAGTQTRYWSGDVAEDIQGIGWHFMPNVRSRLHSVGELAANPFGLHDVHGNVGEFVNDHWRQDYYRQFEKTHSIDPRGPIEDNPSRIVRGGGFNALKELCGSFPRFVVIDSSHWIGFRAVLNIDAVRYSESQTTTGWPANAPKPAITPSRSEPAANREAVLAEYYAVNRRAAEKALSVGGSVLLERLPDHEFVGLGAGDTLPNGPFLVRIWSVFNSSTVTNADLEVLRGLRHIREISASASFNRLDAAAIPHVAAVRAPLQFLSFHHPIKTSDLAALPTLEQLTMLWVLGHDVDDDWKCLEKFPHLKSLNVNQGPIPSLASLSKYPQLRSLALTVTEEPDLSALPELQRENPRLRVIAQVGTNHRVVGNDPLRAAVPDLLAAGLPLLAVRFDGTLNPLNNENIDKTFDAGVTSVKLDVIPASVRLSDAVRGQLTLLGMQLLVAAGHQEADLLAAVLADRHDMQTLYLQDSDLTDTGLKKLESLIGLQYLDISGTKVTEDGVKAFRAAIPGCILRTSTGTLEPDYAADPAYPGRPQTVSQSTGWSGWLADAPPPAIAPFDADQAKKHQEDWAAYLKLPVEYTNSIGMKFRLIPPGEFLMGGTPEEIAAALEADLTPFNGEVNWWSACLRSEGPRHRVRLTRPFYLGAHEVTQRQYHEIIGENPSENSPTGSNRERVAGLDTANFPVEFLSWHDAVQFCNRLNEREQRSNRHLTTMPPTLSDTGTGYRLPTEAEWEFACRAGTTSRYWTGHEVDSVLKAGWFQVNDGGRTHAVGELLANPFGLFDVHGNAWEWTADGWNESWYQQFAEKLAVNPVCPLTDQPVAMMKAGTWPAFEHFCRAASRIPWPCDARNSLQGMRVSLPVEAVQESLKVSGSYSTASETLAEYYARNRQAAERALAVDGNSSEVLVEIPQPFEWRRITAGQKLPQEPFVIRQWSVKNATKVSNRDLDVLAGLRHVLNLNVMAKSGLDAGCVPRIGAVRSSLKELAIGHITLKTSDLSKLPEMPHVHFLWISAEQVNDEWRFLTKFPAIRAISLYGSPIPDLLPLREAKHLRRLLITTWGTAPDLTQIHEIQSGNPNLRVFLDMDQQHATLGKDPAKAAVKQLLEAGVPVSGTLPDGTAVALASDDVDEKNTSIYAVRSIPPEVILTEELRGLLTHVELQNIQAVGHQQADALAEILKDRQDVEILNLVNSDLTDEGLRSLQQLTGLRLLNLNGTKVTAEGVAAFHRAVPGCHLNTDAGDVPVDYLAVPEPPATAP